MRLSNFQVLDISCLYGAYFENTNGAGFYIIGIGVNIIEHEIYVEIQSAEDPDDTAALPWSAIEDWELQLRPHRHPVGC